MYQFLMCVYCVYHYVKNSQNKKVNKSPSQMAGWVSLQLKGFMKARQIHTALQTDPVCRLSFSLNVKRWFHWMVLLSLKQWAAKRRWILFDHQHCNTIVVQFSPCTLYITCINLYQFLTCVYCLCVNVNKSPMMGFSRAYRLYESKTNSSRLITESARPPFSLM